MVLSSAGFRIIFQGGSRGWYWKVALPPWLMLATSGVTFPRVLYPGAVVVFHLPELSIAKLPLSGDARIILYADDILLYKPVNSAEDIGDLLNLENVQKFAGRIITRQWKSTYSNLLTRLNWHPLHVPYS
jgi:hypothetical protein